MEGITNGDTLAFSELYGRYKGKMLYYFFRMLGSNEDKAQDFLQDLFMRIVEKPDLFDSSRKFSTWIYSVAHNMCKNEYRKLEVRKVIDKNAEGEALNKAADNNLQDKETDINRFTSALHSELAQLDNDKKTTFLLRFKEGLSIKEIGETMECSEGTVKSRLFYTNKILSNKLGHFKNI